MHTPPKGIVRLVHVLQLMFCFYYYSFLSKGGIKSSKDEDKLESFDVKDGGRLYLNDLGRILYCYRTMIHVHVLQNCNAYNLIKHVQKLYSIIVHVHPKNT